MTTPVDPRDELLAKILDHVRTNGLSAKLSLRQLATDIGSSHRMLCYHFGSRDGVLVAVLQALRVEEQEQLLRMASGSSREDAIMALWSFYTLPINRHRLATFFYVFGLAAQDPEGFEQFLNSLDNWSRLITDLGVEQGIKPEVARREADMVVATIRGLFLIHLSGAEMDRLNVTVEHLVGQLSKGRRRVLR